MPYNKLTKDQREQIRDEYHIQKLKIKDIQIKYGISISYVYRLVQEQRPISSIKPFYSIPSLAKLIGYSDNGARHLLFRMNIPIHLIRGKYIIFIHDLERYAPELFKSIIKANEYNSISSWPVVPQK